MLCSGWSPMRIITRLLRLPVQVSDSNSGSRPESLQSWRLERLVMTNFCRCHCACFSCSGKQRPTSHDFQTSHSANVPRYYPSGERANQILKCMPLHASSSVGSPTQGGGMGVRPTKTTANRSERKIKFCLAKGPCNNRTQTPKTKSV